MEDRKFVGASQTTKYADGTIVEVPTRIGNQGDMIVTTLHGDLYEAAERGCLFQAANQAAVTTTVALATTYTGLCVSNPAGSGVKLLMRRASWAFSVAPAGIAPVAIGGGWAAAGVVTHTTPLSVYNMKIGGTETSRAYADGAATIVGTPRVIMPIVGGFTAGALFGTSPSVVDLGGFPVLPGGYVFIYTLTVGVGLGGMIWEEVPL